MNPKLNCEEWEHYLLPELDGESAFSKNGLLKIADFEYDGGGLWLVVRGELSGLVLSDCNGLHEYCATGLSDDTYQLGELEKEIIRPEMKYETKLRFLPLDTFTVLQVNYTTMIQTGIELRKSKGP